MTQYKKVLQFDPDNRDKHLLLLRKLCGVYTPLATAGMKRDKELERLCRAPWGKAVVVAPDDARILSLVASADVHYPALGEGWGCEKAHGR